MAPTLLDLKISIISKFSPVRFRNVSFNLKHYFQAQFYRMGDGHFSERNFFSFLLNIPSFILYSGSRSISCHFTYYACTCKQGRQFYLGGGLA